MGNRTVLYEAHVAAGAKIVDFGGWDMPLHYGSQVEEHHAVRQHAGMFDVSHMTVVDVSGPQAEEFLRRLLANDVAKLVDRGRALYTCMLNHRGGVVDDLIVYRFAPTDFRLVVNASTREKDLAWLDQESAGFDVSILEQPQTAMIAVQGPRARELAANALPEAHRAEALALKPFSALSVDGLFVGRTGYTGEDGWEIVVPAEAGRGYWDVLLANEIRPCGLGARDTLRLEAAMNLYGNDMDEDTSPLVAGLGWTVAWEPQSRAFIGRDALEAERTQEPAQRFCGLLLEGRGVLRSHQRVIVNGLGEGEVTSGGFSPTIGRSIGLARLPAGDYDRAQVEIRNKLVDARIVATPFVRHGKIATSISTPS